jgi:hypothetical protein
MYMYLPGAAKEGFFFQEKKAKEGCLNTKLENGNHGVAATASHPVLMSRRCKLESGRAPKRAA